jgi:glycine betaine/proline transport system ATP-binding protein
VDRSRILTAESAMRPVRTTARDSDGPRTALHRMRDHSIDSIYVTDRDRQLLGLLEADAASRAIEAKAETITDHLTQDFRKVPPDEPLQNLFAMFSEKSYPIAVVDEQQRLLGVVVKGAVLDELARAGEQ